jgi:hypothetical protein
MIPPLALKQLPASVAYDPLDHTTLDKLAWCVLTELDLIVEDQDGADPKDLPKIRKWLAKWAPHLVGV